jgi:O-antigen ligase
MVTAWLVAAYGLLQGAGPGAAQRLAYEYNTAIRFAGRHFLRTFSTFVQPFPFALYVMVAILIGASVALADPRRLRNLVFLVSIPCSVAMATSIVRASYLGLVLGLLVLAWFRFRLVGVLPLVLLAIVVLLPASVLSTALSSSSLGERQSGWEATGSLVLSSPWGVGIGATGAAAEKVADVTGSDTSTYQPDNYYFKMLVELGVVGMWLFVVIVASGFTEAVA